MTRLSFCSQECVCESHIIGTGMKCGGNRSLDFEKVRLPALQFPSVPCVRIPRLYPFFIVYPAFGGSIRGVRPERFELPAYCSGVQNTQWEN